MAEEGGGPTSGVRLGLRVELKGQDELTDAQASRPHGRGHTGTRDGAQSDQGSVAAGGRPGSAAGSCIWNPQPPSRAPGAAGCVCPDRPLPVWPRVSALPGPAHTSPVRARGGLPVQLTLTARHPVHSAGRSLGQEGVWPAWPSDGPPSRPIPLREAEPHTRPKTHAVPSRGTVLHRRDVGSSRAAATALRTSCAHAYREWLRAPSQTSSRSERGPGGTRTWVAPHGPRLHKPSR